MPSRRNLLRVGMAVLVTPLILAAFIGLFLLSATNFSSSINDLPQVVADNLVAIGLVQVLNYVVLIALLLPYCLWLRRRQKFRLGFFLLGAYFTGGLAQVIVSLGMGMVPLSLGVRPMEWLLLFFSSMLSGGTNSFFQATLFWYIGGMPGFAQAVQLEPQH